MEFIQLIFSVFKSIFSFKLAYLFFACLIFYSIFLFLRSLIK